MYWQLPRLLQPHASFWFYSDHFCSLRRMGKEEWKLNFIDILLSTSPLSSLTCKKSAKWLQNVDGKENTTTNLINERNHEFKYSWGIYNMPGPGKIWFLIWGISPSSGRH